MASRPGPARRHASRRRKLLTRSVPVLIIAAAAFVFGARVATGPGRAERHLVTGYVSAWSRGDLHSMYGMLDAGSRARVTESAFVAEVKRAADTATARSLTVVRVGHVGGSRADVVMTAHTRLWGTLRETLWLPLTGAGSSARVHLQNSMLFPGLRSGETLSRRTRMPTRGTLLASDGTPLAEGPDRTSPIPETAEQIVGTLGAATGAQRRHDLALGYPSRVEVGLDGLERIFQHDLAGTPGGSLLAGSRSLATAQPAQAAPVTTTINPRIEDATIEALGGRYAGMTVMDPRTGALEALTGIAFSAPQPPGSTMKIITATAALQAHLTTLNTEYPESSGATIDGYTLENAGGEVCGGTLLYAFATSCNSVYAPLGVKVGADRLVSTAERYGFNHRSSILGAARSTIPSAAAIGSDLAVGSSAIGQGKVLATPLQMADVAATIADGGRRPIPSLLADAKPRFVHVTTPAVARGINKMMVAVITEGTGEPAAIPGVQVAGKTGTAELVDTSSKSASANPKNTDSWFIAYAPAGAPRVVVSALFPGAGYGAATAAPAVRSTLEAALGIG